MSTSTALLNKKQAASEFRSTVIQEDDWTSKFHFTDKHGNLGGTYLGADLFNLFGVPDAFARQFNDKLPKIARIIEDWVQKWQDHVAGWELYLRDGVIRDHIHFQFVVTQKGTEYDQQLAEALTHLDMSLYEDTGSTLIRVTTLMVPSVSEEEIADVWT